MTGRLRVCHLITALPYGGAEHLLLDLVTARDDVDCLVGYFGAEDALASELRTAGATVHHLDESFRFDPRATVRLSQFLRSQSIDVLHLHLPYAQTVGRLIGTISDVDAIVSTQHNVPQNYHPVTRTTERLTRPLDDATVAVSQGVEASYTGSAHRPHDLGDSWCTIPNGIDVAGFESKAQTADLSPVFDQIGGKPSVPLLLNVGRYVPVKGQVDLVEAFAESDTQAELVIVGHGPLEAEIQDAARSHGVKDVVHVTGRVPEVHPYYAAADGFVSASTAEGLPITILEAMAAGLPVVAPDIPGVREVVRDEETGVLYASGDQSALTRALETCSDPSLRSRYGDAGRKRVAEQFDIETMAATYVDLYRRVLDRSG